MMKDDASDAGPAQDPFRFTVDDFSALAPVEEEEIPTIGADMLHHDRVDLEAGMSAAPPVTIGLMLVCAAVFARQLFIDGLSTVQRVVDTGAVHGESIRRGEFWRLISGGFMHASGDHIVGNMLMLFVLGMACEHAFGRQGMLFLFVGTCITGSLLAMFGELPVVGASGAIFGLAGALIALMYVHRRRIELRDHRVGIVLAVWSAYTLALGLLSPIVSNAAHLGGLIGGLALGALLPTALLNDRAELASRPTTRLRTILTLAALVYAAACFLPRLA